MFPNHAPLVVAEQYGLFADDMPLINQIIDHTTGGIDAHPIYDIPTSPVWEHDRVILIGDAAHATTREAQSA